MRLFACWFTLLAALAGAQETMFVAKLKTVKPPTEGADWKAYKDAKGKLTVLLPRGFIQRSIPEGEVTTTLYCIAGGSPRDYRLLKVVSDTAEVPKAKLSLAQLKVEKRRRLSQAPLG